MDVRLVEKDHAMPIALSAGQHALELLDKGLPPLWVGPAEQLLGFLPRQLPRQLAAGQDRADRLATAPQPKRSRTQWTRRRKVQRGAGSAPSRGGVPAV